MTQNRQPDQALLELRRLYVLRDEVLPEHEALPPWPLFEPPSGGDYRIECEFGRAFSCGTVRCLGGSAVLHPAMQGLGADYRWCGDELQVLPHFVLDEKSEETGATARLGHFFGMTNEEAELVFGVDSIEKKRQDLETVIQRKEAEIEGSEQ